MTSEGVVGLTLEDLGYLRELGLKRIRLITGNPRTWPGLDAFGLTIAGTVAPGAGKSRMPFSQANDGAAHTNTHAPRGISHFIDVSDGHPRATFTSSRAWVSEPAFDAGPTVDAS